MAGKTKIEWATDVWNPIVGCSVVSPGCTNCYAMRMAARIEAMHFGRHADSASFSEESIPSSHYEGLTQPSKAGPVWTGKVALASEHTLTAPLRWKRPRKIFVNSMGDLFHESIPDAWIDRVFAVMALAPQHTFQVLTKRSKRMREYCSNPETPRRVTAAADEAATIAYGHHWLGALGKAGIGYADSVVEWPLRQVWAGVSAEDQPRADERIPDLLATPAAVRLVSAEPLLGPINFRRIRIAPNHHTMIDALAGYLIGNNISGSGQERTNIDWIIVGGESGKGARPMQPDWARSIRDQCAASVTPFFFKQWGEWLDEAQATAMGAAPDAEMFDRFGRPTGDRWHFYHEDDLTGGAMIRVGKRRAGALLDGREHREFPR